MEKVERDECQFVYALNTVCKTFTKVDVMKRRMTGLSSVAAETTVTGESADARNLAASSCCRSAWVSVGPVTQRGQVHVDFHILLDVLNDD